jgi:hypothetical protein
LDGNPVPSNCDVEGYCEVNLEGSSEYRFEVQFDIDFVLERLSGNDYVMRRGPEVLSIDVRDNIDTWLGERDDLITIPEDVALEEIKCYHQYQWAGPTESKSGRRRYGVSLYDERTSERRSMILTPYADAGNEGAAFRTVFPLVQREN